MGPHAPPVAEVSSPAAAEADQLDEAEPLETENLDLEHPRSVWSSTPRAGPDPVWGGRVARKPSAAGSGAAAACGLRSAGPPAAPAPRVAAGGQRQPVFVELFSGVGALAQAARVVGFATEALDIKCECDLRDRRTQADLAQRVSAGSTMQARLGTPLTTLCRFYMMFSRH